MILFNRDGCCRPLYFWRSLTMALSDRRAMINGVKFHHIYVPNDLRPSFFALYYPHYRHIPVYPFFSSVPSRGSVSTVDERRQYSIIVHDDLIWNVLVVGRASKQYGHAHTSHQSTSSVGLAGTDDEFSVTCAATELMHETIH